MCIDTCLRPMTRDESLEFVNIIAQVLGRDRGIFHEGKRLRIAFLSHREPERHCTQLPNTGLTGGLDNGVPVITKAASTTLVFVCSKSRRQELRRVVV